MKVKILGSNSDGNCYILQAADATLILELGVAFKEIKIALDFDLTKVVGALVTHEHGDHSKEVMACLAAGINVYASQGTLKALKAEVPRAKVIKAHDRIKIGPFQIYAFDVNHDAAEPLGFIINHPESGNILFITDTAYTQYTFNDIHNVLIEANYCEQILSTREGTLHPKLISRVRRSHMSIQTCSELLAANNFKDVNNIVLIHLSDGNSDEAGFKKRIEAQTGKKVTIAKKGVELEMNKTAF